MVDGVYSTEAFYPAPSVDTAAGGVQEAEMNEVEELKGEESVI